MLKLVASRKMGVDDMWDEPYPTDKACEHYLLRHAAGASTPNSDDRAPAEEVLSHAPE